MRTLLTRTSMQRPTLTRRLTLVAAAAVALPMLVALAPTGASAADVQQPWIGVASGKCLDVVGDAKKKGAAVELDACSGVVSQQWGLSSSGTLSTFAGKFCLQADKGGKTAGTKLVLAKCTGKKPQLFDVTSGGAIVARASGLCVDVVSEGTAAGTPVKLWTCTGRANQQWSRTAPTTPTPTTTTTTPTPTQSGCPAAGHITYTLSRSSQPTSAELDAYSRITTAMDAALKVYNCYLNVTKALTVSYVPSVATADATWTGNMRFGATSSMQQITAMHEIGHTMGVGTYSTWSSMLSNGVWTGSQANTLLRSITGNSTDAIHGDSQHFWPYGLNYTSEVKSNQDLINHVLIVAALRRDMGLSS